ncbi:PRTRC genetic system protein E [Flavobacterium chryseum]|uniref:PRTRC system protein E n=1 Tax=Flavobacterium sp. P3160 TaxID=2512113 RepID=UPI001061055E|nr:PRTRC system protein E [Flavobacterium sp. P3160]TDO68772.1 PRTRC genetic system protein E [Flavobacterium sp. P3160]
MNFFTQLIETGIKDVTIEIKVADDGRVTVLTSPKTIAKDKGLNTMKPLLLTGTTEELDCGYFQAITKPLKKTSAFFNNVENYEANLESSKKETAEAKSAKENEKNAQSGLVKVLEKLKTPADWSKKRDAVKQAIEDLLEFNPDSSAAKKAKKDLEINLAKVQMGDGLFSENEIEESVEEIPTEELADDSAQMFDEVEEDQEEEE